MHWLQGRPHSQRETRSFAIGHLRSEESAPVDKATFERGNTQIAKCRPEPMLQFDLRADLGRLDDEAQVGLLEQVRA